MEPGKGIALLRNRSSGTIARNDFSLDSGYETKFLHEYGDITGINSQLWLSVIIMQIIQSGGEVKLHSTEWVNKSSGKGDTELIVNDGKSVQKYSYPYWFPFTPYTEVFPRLFPWAIFSADEEFFEENDMNLWREYHCYYDKEDGEWLVVGDTFEEFRKKLSPMRSIDHAGEVAEYMMILSLNELGKAFLNVDKFVSQNQPYASTRPNAE